MGIYNNFIIQKGASWQETIYWKDSAGYPVDLTDYSAKIQVAENYGLTPIINETLTIDFPSEGRIDISFDSNFTANLTAGYYVYEIELTDPSSNIHRILEGQLYISDEVIP